MRLVVTKRNLDAVNTRAGVLPCGEIPMDTYRERLIKYIPVEALVLYVAVYGSTYALFVYQPWFPALARGIFLAGIGTSFAWLWMIEEVHDIIQLVISTAGFVVWIFAFGVIPVADLSWYNQVVAAVLLPVWVYGTPLLEGWPERW